MTRARQTCPLGTGGSGAHPARRSPRESRRPRSRTGNRGRPVEGRASSCARARGGARATSARHSIAARRRPERRTVVQLRRRAHRFVRQTCGLAAAEPSSFRPARTDASPRTELRVVDVDPGRVAQYERRQGPPPVSSASSSARRAARPATTPSPQTTTAPVRRAPAWTPTRASSGASTPPEGCRSTSSSARSVPLLPSRAGGRAAAAMAATHAQLSRPSSCDVATVAAWPGHGPGRHRPRLTRTLALRCDPVAAVRHRPRGRQPGPSRRRSPPRLRRLRRTACCCPARPTPLQPWADSRPRPAASPQWICVTNDWSNLPATAEVDKERKKAVRLGGRVRASRPLSLSLYPHPGRARPLPVS